MADKYKGKEEDAPWGRTASKRGKLESFGHFLYNSETGEYLGRSSLSWLKITIFYIIYYTLLAGFWAAMLVIFFQTIDDRKPTWQNTDGLIGGSPGLGFRPLPHQESVESTLIWIDNKEKTYNYWSNRTYEFMEPYDTLREASGQYLTDCDDDQISPPSDTQGCLFDIKKLVENSVCHQDSFYGYDVHTPCIMLKLNKIYGWIPDYYNNTSELEGMENKMPKALVQRMKDHANKDDGSLPPLIWVHCEGENPADKENLGPIEYLPAPGFRTHFFPYMNVPAYMSPLVAVKFSNLKTGVLINVECRAWAKNIKHSRMERLGMVHFELLID